MRDARRNNDPLACVNFPLSAVHTHPQRAGHNLEALLLLGVKMLGRDKPSTVYHKAHPKHVALARQECMCSPVWALWIVLGIVARAYAGFPAISKRAPLEQQGVARCRDRCRSSRRVSH